MHTGAFHWAPKSLVEQPSVDLRCEMYKDSWCWFGQEKMGSFCFRHFFTIESIYSRFLD